MGVSQSGFYAMLNLTLLNLLLHYTYLYFLLALVMFCWPWLNLARFWFISLEGIFLSKYLFCTICILNVAIPFFFFSLLHYKHRVNKIFHWITTAEFSRILKHFWVLSLKHENKKKFIKWNFEILWFWCMYFLCSMIM